MLRGDFGAVRARKRTERRQAKLLPSLLHNRSGVRLDLRFQRAPHSVHLVRENPHLHHLDAARRIENLLLPFVLGAEEAVLQAHRPRQQQPFKLEDGGNGHRGVLDHHRRVQVRGERPSGGQQRVLGFGALRPRHLRQVELRLHLLVLPAANPPPGGHVRAHHLALEPARLLHPGQLRLPHEDQGGAAGAAVVFVLLRKRHKRDKFHAVQGASLPPRLRREVRLRAVHADFLPGGGHHSLRADFAVLAENLQKA